jgi:hypothetical protein
MGALAHEAHLWSLVLDDEPPVNGVRPPIDEVRFVFRVARDLHRPRQRAQRSGQGQRRSSRANRGRSDSSAPAHQPGSALPDRLTRARRQPTDQPEPRLVDRADARARTGDPFITREGQARDGRPLAGTGGHVFPGDEAVPRLIQWTRIPARARADVPVLYPPGADVQADATDATSRRGRAFVVQRSRHTGVAERRTEVDPVRPRRCRPMRLGRP